MFYQSVLYKLIISKVIFTNTYLIITIKIIYILLKPNIHIHYRYHVLDALHELMPKSAGQWPTQKSYKKVLRIQKECGRPYDFCRVADNVGWRHCAYIIHVRAMLFCTYNQTIFIINNINKIFQ